jgi:hypothetical protein
MDFTAIYIGIRIHKEKEHPGDMVEKILFHRSYA